jgi:ferredoxin
VGRLNRVNIRCISRSVSDYEFILSMDKLKHASGKMASAFLANGVRTLTPSWAFPMETDRWPGKMWNVSHKPLAVAAGLGQFGLNRLILHPRFGGFMMLTTLLIDAKVDVYDQPIDYNPCIDCKLCVAACPTGAIREDGYFYFSNCMTHNYRDRMGGFSDWVEKIASSKDAFDYRHKVPDKETISMWQSLSYGMCNRSTYCMAVCPAGEDNIGPFIEDRKAYNRDVVKPFQEKEEPIFVIPGSDADAYVKKRYPHKTIRRVGNGLRPDTVANFFNALPLVFQREQSKGLNATYHFSFSGSESVQATVTIKDKTIEVADGHVGKSDIHIQADAKTWIAFLSKEKNLIAAMVSRKIRVKGSPLLMGKFAKCFPA